MPSRQPQTPASPSPRKLPIGIQTFRALREGGCYYVDKTRFIGRMASRGKHYFLSRPRRFGKSLLVDTIGELFAGNEALFQGLAIHRDWDWQTRHPVLRLDFARGDFSDPTYLGDNVAAQLDRLERQANAPARYHTAPERLADLIERLSERENPVVVLVDEYDKPILDALDAPPVAKSNRNYLRGLYGTLKSVEAHVRLSFLTGVSKFSKVSLFSGLNNLTDITFGHPLRRSVRLHGGGTLRRVRRRAARHRSRRAAALVQRLQLALNEEAPSAETAATLRRIGRALGEREGTTPDDSPFLAAERAESHAQGRVEGRVQGRVEGRAEERRDMLQALAAVRFGPAAAKTLAPLLAAADYELLARFSARLLQGAAEDELVDMLAGGQRTSPHPRR